MTKIALQPIEETAFSPIVEATHWKDDFDPTRLRVATDLGWMVTVSETAAGPEVQTLVGYSTEQFGTRRHLLPPDSLEDAVSRMTGFFGGSKLLKFNDDYTAKGLGSKLMNHPDAVRNHDAKHGMFVREVPFEGMHDIYRRDHLDVGLGRAYLLGRHGLLLARALVEDIATRSLRGTERSIAHMEQPYGEKPLVLMETPPSWQIENEHRLVYQSVPPKAMLVRGGEFAGQNVMRLVGTALPRPAA